MFTDAIQRFLLSKQAAGLAASSVINYRRCLTRFATQYHTWPPCPDEIEAYLAQRRAQVKPITANGDYRALAVFFNWCHRRKIITENPLDIIEKPRRVKTIPKAAPRDVIKKLFTAIDAQAAAGDLWAIRDRALFRLAYDTGARATELATIQRADVDLLLPAIYTIGKGGQQRWLFFSRKTAAALQDWLNVHPGSPALFTTQINTPISRARIYYALQNWCRAINITLTVHQLRHSYATHALRKGIDIRLVQKQLGHSNISTTAMYLSATDEELRHAQLTLSPGGDM